MATKYFANPHLMRNGVAANYVASAGLRNNRNTLTDQNVWQSYNNCKLPRTIRERMLKAMLLVASVTTTDANATQSELSEIRLPHCLNKS